MNDTASLDWRDQQPTKPSIEARIVELINELSVIRTPYAERVDPFLVLAQMGLSDALENYREYKLRST